IAGDLGLQSPDLGAATILPEAWKNPKHPNDFRLFISHISQDRAKAVRLKDCLDEYGIVGFVAHQISSLRANGSRRYCWPCGPWRHSWQCTRRALRKVPGHNKRLGSPLLAGYPLYL